MLLLQRRDDAEPGKEGAVRVKEFPLQGVARGDSPRPDSPSPKDLLPSALLTSIPPSLHLQYSPPLFYFPQSHPPTLLSKCCL